MKTDNTILRLTVGEPVSAGLARAVAAMKAARQGKAAQPYFGAGFDDVGELVSVCTPKRWELIGVLRDKGGQIADVSLVESSIAAAAKSARW